MELLAPALAPEHVLPLPPPLLLPLPHQTDLALHQRLAAQGTQLEERVGCEGALLCLKAGGGRVKAEFRCASNDQVGGFHNDHVGGVAGPVREAAGCCGDEAGAGCGAGVGLQDDDITGS